MQANSKIHYGSYIKGKLLFLWFFRDTEELKNNMVRAIFSSQFLDYYKCTFFHLKGLFVEESHISTL